MISTRFVGRAAAGSALALALAACNQDSLLTAPTPDVVQPKDIAGPSALPSAYASAIGDFQVAYAGGYGTGLDYNEGLTQISGLLSDELLNAETYTTRIEVDRRATHNINGTTLQTFQDAQRARATADLVASRFRQYLPSDPRGAEIQAIAAYMYIMMAEDYCNGVPTSKVNDDGSFTYSPPQSGTALLTIAIAKFDSAIVVASAAGASGATAINLARIGKGRALVDLNNYAAAAAAVASVPDNFNYSIQHSTNSGRENNASFAFNYLEGRFSVSDREGGNGIAFVSLNDPRNPVIDNGTGFDGSTEQFLPTKFPSRSAPTPLAIGSEARLIEAEAALKAGNLPLFLASLNRARAAAPTYTPDGSSTSAPEASPPPLTLADIGATATDQQNLLFRERALTFFLTSHRVGDLRRLIWQYGRNSETVFPTGPYQATNPDKSGTNYGTDVNLPIPMEESNNPSFTPAACTNRSAAFN